MEKMYGWIGDTGLTYGQAIDRCIHKGERIAREHWGGFWELKSTDNFHGSEDILIAVLKDDKGWAPATPYLEDIKAEDWMIVL